MHLNWCLLIIPRRGYNRWHAVAYGPSSSGWALLDLFVANNRTILMHPYGWRFTFIPFITAGGAITGSRVRGSVTRTRFRGLNTPVSRLVIGIDNIIRLLMRFHYISLMIFIATIA